MCFYCFFWFYLGARNNLMWVPCEACCALDETVCKNVEDAYRYFYRFQNLPSVHAECYYNFFDYLFFVCGCASKLHLKVPPTKELSCGIGGQIQSRIYGGKDAVPCEFPWMAIFIVKPTGKRYHYECGGVLIDSKHVLTAAHCVKRGKFANEMAVVLGTVDAYRQDFKVGVASFIIHPRYKKVPRVIYNDIAILKLSKEVQYTGCIQPICLPNAFHIIEHPDNCFTAGWGADETGENQRHLKKVEAPILDVHLCGQLLVDYKPGHLCAGHLEGGKDSCEGDSGGPLMCFSKGQWILAGIVSYGLNCAIPYNPGVYANVKFYMNWIMNNLQ